MKNKNAYLTVDDGPSKDFIPKVDFLYTKKIPVIWFCEGRNIKERMEHAVYAIKKSQIIGNHAWDHTAFSDLSLEKCFEQIKETDSIIENAYIKAETKRPVKYFRFPYGDKGGHKNLKDYKSNILYNKEGESKKQKIQKYLLDLGYTQSNRINIKYNYFVNAGFLNDVDWQWTYDCFEYTIFSRHQHGIDSIEKVLERMDENVPEGCRGLNYFSSDDIILTHDHDKSSKYFEIIINKLLEKGIVFKSSL